MMKWAHNRERGKEGLLLDAAVNTVFNIFLPIYTFYGISIDAVMRQGHRDE